MLLRVFGCQQADFFNKPRLQEDISQFDGMTATIANMAFCLAYLVVDCKFITFDIISFTAAVWPGAAVGGGGIVFSAHVVRGGSGCT